MNMYVIIRSPKAIEFWYELHNVTNSFTLTIGEISIRDVVRLIHFFSGWLME